MSQVEPGPEGGREAAVWGSAADYGHVYQSAGSQYISHLYLRAETGPSASELVHAGLRGAALERTEERVSLLICALSLTQAEWQARCEELKSQADRAKAEGRAEALAEVQEQLQAAELRVMKAQQMMQEAVRERAKTEELLTQAQQELALRRRAEERRERDETLRRLNAGPDSESQSAKLFAQEGERFEDFVERAAAELGAVRDDLRYLGHGGADSAGGGGDGPTVIKGDAVPRRPGNENAVSSGVRTWTLRRAARAVQTSSSPSLLKEGAAAPDSLEKFLTAYGYRPGRRRLLMIGAMWLLCLLPPCVVMLVVTANRAAYASHPSWWKAALFTTLSLVGGGVAYVIAALPAFALVTELDRLSEGGANVGGLIFGVLVSLISMAVASETPLSWPGPVGAWGVGIASAVGVG